MFAVPFRRIPVSGRRPVVNPVTRQCCRANNDEETCAVPNASETSARLACVDTAVGLRGRRRPARAWTAYFPRNLDRFYYAAVYCLAPAA